MAKFFTDDFLNERRKEFLRALVKFQYQINNGSWYIGRINSKQISGTDIIFFVDAPCSGTSDTITAVRVYDTRGELAGSQSTSVARTYQNGALFRFVFPLIEQE